MISGFVLACLQKNFNSCSAINVASESGHTNNHILLEFVIACDNNKDVLEKLFKFPHLHLSFLIGNGAVGNVISIINYLF
jgi:hypothetical protein